MIFWLTNFVQFGPLNSIRELYRRYNFAPKITQPRIVGFYWNSVYWFFMGLGSRTVVETHLFWNPKWRADPKFSMFKSL